MDVNNIFAFVRANQKRIGNEFRLRRAMLKYETLIFASGFERMSIKHAQNLIDQLVSIAKRMISHPFTTELSWTIVIACQKFELNFEDSITKWGKGMRLTRYKQAFVVDIEFIERNEFKLTVREVTNN